LGNDLLVEREISVGCKRRFLAARIISSVGGL
jgi:hypothetical protein